MPSTYKITLTTVSVLAGALAVTPPASAQDGPLSYGSARGVTSSVMFAESDIDKDGGLDREEFIGYATAQSKAGDKLFAALVLAGDFDNQFNAYDYNADGFLTVEEMKVPQLGQASEIESSDIDEEDTEADD